ncbi:MAG TPA: glycosyltransferase [Pirellulales bacterium]|jgi:glycosyltransferase involved in cell wall biosynthesis|nr:glycosyltransferase [Pirellulales bacterium]
MKSYQLGIISCLPAARDGQGGLVCNHSIGRLLDMLRQLVPGAKLCIPVLDNPQRNMMHRLGFPAEDVTALPPLRSVTSAQRYFFSTRRTVRQFARQVDALFIRVPFQIPTALVGLQTPKLLHVAGNPYEVIAASSDYRGIMKRVALAFAAHSNATLRRMAAEPNTRVATNGAEMWKIMRCRHGRVVVSSCIYQREMRPREDMRLGDPPKILFVGYLRPEKGIHTLLDAFENLRAARPLKLTLVGGTDKRTGADAFAYDRICNSPYHDDITMTGMLDFGEPLFELYRSHDVFVLPSLSEGTPRTLVEARAFGCPVVATRAGGIPSSVEHDRNGLLVEPNDSPGLADAISRILSDETLRQRLIAEGLRGSSQESLEAFAGQLVDELDILVGRKAQAASVSVATNEQHQAVETRCPS